MLARSQGLGEEAWSSEGGRELTSLHLPNSYWNFKSHTYVHIQFLKLSNFSENTWETDGHQQPPQAASGPPSYGRKEDLQDWGEGGPEIIQKPLRAVPLERPSRSVSSELCPLSLPR